MIRSRPRPISSARWRREQRRLDHGFARHRAGIERRVGARILVHQPRQQVLVERAPIGADAHRLAVLDRAFDHRGELRVALVLEADIAGIDAIFGERFGAGRIIGQELMADIMEIADERHVAAHLVELLADMRHGGRRLIAVDRDAHELGAGAGQGCDLLGRRGDIGGIGIGHRLDDNRAAAADGHGALAGPDPHADRAVARRRPRFGGFGTGPGRGERYGHRALFRWRGSALRSRNPPG